jgi:hypothetical protein
MDRTKLFKPIIFLAIFILLANTMAQKLYWYYSIWWFDMPVHFLGGLWQGIFFLWYFSEVRLPFCRRPIREMNRETIMYGILFVLLVGVSWEAGEFLTNNLIGRESLSILDTTSDIFFDLAGGSLAFLYYVKHIMSIGLNKVE